MKRNVWILLTTYVRDKETLEMTKTSYKSMMDAGTDFKIFWWDNGSIPELKEYMKSRCDDYIICKSNRGCVGSRQWAYIYLNYDYLVTVDNDILFPVDWLKELLVGFNHDSIGAISPLVSDEKPPSLSTKPDFKEDMVQGGVMAIRRAMINDIGGISAGAKVYGISDDTHIAIRAGIYGWVTKRAQNISCYHMCQTTLNEEEKNELMANNRLYAYDKATNWWKN